SIILKRKKLIAAPCTCRFGCIVRRAPASKQRADQQLAEALLDDRPIVESTEHRRGEKTQGLFALNEVFSGVKNLRGRAWRVDIETVDPRPSIGGKRPIHILAPVAVGKAD